MNSIFFPCFISNRTLKDRSFFFFSSPPQSWKTSDMYSTGESVVTLSPSPPLATDSAVNSAGLPSFLHFCFSALK